MPDKPDYAGDGQPLQPEHEQGGFSGYWFKVPVELNRLALKPAELKAYLVVTHAIQRDRNGGFLSISQIATRTSLSKRHARVAIDTLCQRRLLIRVNRVTGGELTRKEDWNGRTVTYANPIQWKQKDAGNPGPTGPRSEPGDEGDDRLRNALRNGVMSCRDEEENASDPGPTGEGNLRPVGERHLRPVGERHLESLELSEGGDLNDAQPVVEPSAFSGVDFERSDCDKRITGYASAKSAEDSPGDRLFAVHAITKPKADAPATAAGAKTQNPSHETKTSTPTPAYDAASETEATLEDVLDCFAPVELEDWDGDAVPDWVCDATRNAAPDVSEDAICTLLEQKAAAGWQPRRWTSVPALVRDAFAPKPKRARVEPWNSIDIANVQNWLAAFMEGEEPPPKLIGWIIDLAAEHCLRASDVREALEAAWKRSAAPGQKNAPRSWNWFYEILRAAFVPGYAARLPEAPAAPHPSHRATTKEMAGGCEVLDALVASYRCKCGADIRQYTDRVEGTCSCGRKSPIAKVTQVPGKRRAAARR